MFDHRSHQLKLRFGFRPGVLHSQIFFIVKPKSYEVKVKFVF